MTGEKKEKKLTLEQRYENRTGQQAAQEVILGRTKRKIYNNNFVDGLKKLIDIQEKRIAMYEKHYKKLDQLAGTLRDALDQSEKNQ